MLCGALCGLSQLPAVPVLAQCAVSSSFAADDEGWTVDHNAGTGFDWIATGGNPAGYVSVEDVMTPGAATAVAPSAFHGDLGDCIGQVLRIDFRLDTAGAGAYREPFGTVTIAGTSGAASADIVPGTDPLPSSWTTYSLFLDAARWGVSEAAWNAILADVTSIEVDVDSYQQGGDRIDMDNVVLADAPPAPPCGAASHFAADVEGWTVSDNGGTGFDWLASGGNPSGHVSVEDALAPGVATAEAPASFLGDLRGCDGGELRVDFRQDTATAEAPRTQFGTVTLAGPGGSASADLLPGPVPLPFVWRRGSLPMDAASWGVSQVTWLAVLGEVTSLTIDVDSYQQDGDRIDMDNVVLAGRPPPAEVPLLPPLAAPALAVALLATAVRALAAERTRRPGAPAVRLTGRGRRPRPPRRAPSAGPALRSTDRSRRS